MGEETDITIRDPDISEKGKRQCKKFAKSFQGQEKYINCILSSPMTRALNTACSAFRNVRDPIDGSALTVIALPELQSLGADINGTGLDPDVLANRYNGVDYERDGTGQPAGRMDVTTYVVEGWNSKDTGKWSAEEAAVAWRVGYMKEFLRKNCGTSSRGSKQVEIAVVTHGSFLRKLVRDGKSS
jgi:bisphosphoglycerate-dependent phosphoglycerate mutase